MPFSGYTPRDWLFVFVPYLLWCLIFGFIWRSVLRRRIVQPSARAMVFSLLFAPTLFPIVREAFILGPASLSLLYVALLGLRFNSAGGTLVLFLLAEDLLPIAVVWALYRFGPAMLKRRK